MAAATASAKLPEPEKARDKRPGARGALAKVGAPPVASELCWAARSPGRSKPTRTVAAGAATATLLRAELLGATMAADADRAHLCCC